MPNDRCQPDTVRCAHTFSNLLKLHHRPKGLRYGDHPGGPQPTTKLGRDGTRTHQHTDTEELIRSGAHDVIIQLLRERAIFNLEMNKFTTPLHMAMLIEHKELQRAVVGTLLAQETKLGTVDHEGNTALHLAVKSGATAVVKQLLEKNAPVDVAGHLGQSPLHMAMSIVDPQVALSIVNVLLKGRAKIDVTDKNNNMPLHLAIARGAGGIVAQMLLSGASIDQAGRNGQSALHMATAIPDEMLAGCTVSKLLRDGAMVDSRDGKGNTALHLAIELERPDVVGRLLEKGADVNAPNNEKTTPYLAAANLGPRNIREKMIGILIAAGAKRDDSSQSYAACLPRLY